MATVLKSPFSKNQGALDVHRNFGGYLLDHLRRHHNSRWCEILSGKAVAPPLKEGKLTINATTHEERTYGEVADQVAAVHAALHRLGIGAGDLICILVASRAELLPMFLGAACANVGCAYEDPGYSVDVLVEWMKSFEFAAICCQPDRTDEALELRAKLPTVKHIIALGEPASRTPGIRGTIVSWSQLMKIGREAHCSGPPSVEYQKNRICYTKSTSGTTGKSKIVVHNHDSLVASVSANSHPQHMGLTTEDVMLCTSSLGHVYALFDCVSKAIVQGASTAFLESSNIEVLLEALQKHKVTALSTVPYVAQCLLDHPQRSSYNLGHLRYVTTATNYISESVAKRLFQELRLKSYIQLYGQTEIVFIAGGLRDGPPRFTSIGRLGMGHEAMVVDTETREPLGPRQQGELVLRGPGLMRGYWGRLIECVTDAGGWYRTGDECYFDEEGWLYLVQRMSEFIFYRSTKIPPAYIEAALVQCAAVKDCAVVGLPHPEDGQLPHAVIVPKPESRHLGPEHYLRFVEASVPKELRLQGGVTLVDEIPRNKLGKLVRCDLLEWVLERRANSNLK